jgi:molybdopterin converting factor small subunit
MEIELKCFGICKEILGGFTYKVKISPNMTVGMLLAFLKAEFPDMAKLKSLRVAINEEYAENGDIIAPGSEVVLIPPVSGG